MVKDGIDQRSSQLTSNQMNSHDHTDGSYNKRFCSVQSWRMQLHRFSRKSNQPPWGGNEICACWDVCV